MIMIERALQLVSGSCWPGACIDSWCCSPNHDIMLQLLTSTTLCLPAIVTGTVWEHQASKTVGVCHNVTVSQCNRVRWKDQAWIGCQNAKSADSYSGTLNNTCEQHVSKTYQSKHV